MRVLVLAKYPALPVAMQRQLFGARAHDTQSFESNQFCQCFGELNFFHALVHLLGLRAAFKLSSARTTFASMVRGSLVKGPCDGKEIPRLLCHLAMEEFVGLVWCEDVSVFASDLKSCGAGRALMMFGTHPRARRMLIQTLRDFGDIFQEGLCTHERSLRTIRANLHKEVTLHHEEQPFRTYRQSHCALLRVGIIWTSTPAGDVWARAMSRARRNYGQCFEEIRILWKCFGNAYGYAFDTWAKRLDAVMAESMLESMAEAAGRERLG